MITQAFLFIDREPLLSSGNGDDFLSINLAASLKVRRENTLSFCLCLCLSLCLSLSLSLSQSLSLARAVPQYVVQSCTPRCTSETMYTSLYIVQRCCTPNPRP